MSVDRSEQRRRLFNLYSANIVLYAPEFANHFACPICGDIYGPDAVEGENPLVTIAHVYPKRCGGTVETLTCGRCNNQIGSKYDNQLTIEHRAHDAFRPGATRSLPGRMTFDGGDIGVRIKGAENSLHLEFVADWTNPADHAALLSQLGRSSNLKFSVSHRWVDKDRHNAALLHSAYLAFFREYGYEYVGGAHAQWIRTILNAERPPGNPFILTLVIPADAGFDVNFMFGTGVVEYEDRRFFVVALPTPEPSNLARCVFLPGFEEKSLDEYRGLLRMPELKERVQVRFHLDYGVPERRLGDPKWRGFLHYLWATALK